MAAMCSEVPAVTLYSSRPRTA